MERANTNYEEDHRLRDHWMGTELGYSFEEIYQEVVMLLKKYGQVSDELVHAILRHACLIEYNRKELVLAEGNRCNMLYLVVKGVCASFYYKEDGQESICNFHIEGEFFFLPHAFFNGENNQVNIKAMTKTSLLCVNKEQCYHLKNQFPDFDKLIQTIVELSAIENELHYYHLRRYNATERVLLAEGKAKIQYLQKHIAQCAIASYLNIAPETFSSIKSKLHKKIIQA